MDYICLDRSFQNPIWLKPINVQWNARFYECGDFCIQIPTSAYESCFSYVYCNERRQTGIVQKVYQEETLEGKFTQISGYFLERKLHNYVIHNTYTATGKNICEACEEIVTTYCTRDNIVIKDWGNLGEKIDKQVTGGYVDEVLYELLKTQKLSFQLTYDFEDDQIYLSFVKGTDRTQSQEENATITFSEAFKNISNVVYTGDSSNYKNFAYVTTGEGDARIVVEVDMTNEGEERQELWVDARDLQTSDTVTLEDLKLQMRQRGVEKLADYVNITNISFDIDTTMVVYTEDFDLGDRADCILVDMGLSYETDIIEANEVWKDNHHTVELVVGDKIPTKYDKLMKG